MRERRIIYQEGDFDEFGIQEALELRKWRNLRMSSDEACAIAVKEI